MRLLRNILATLIFISASAFHSYAQITMPVDTGHVPFDTAKYKAMVKFAFPNPMGYVNDFDHILDNATIDTISRWVFDLKNKTMDQIVVVTVADYSPYDNLGVYSEALSNKWGIGTGDTSKGVMIIVCKPKKEVRITTALGIAKKLSDVACEEITDYFILPQFKRDNYSKGLSDAVKEIIRQLEKN